MPRDGEKLFSFWGSSVTRLFTVRMVRRSQNEKGAFKQSVTIYAKSKHPPTKCEGVSQWGAGNIFNYPTQATLFKFVSCSGNQVRVMVGGFLPNIVGDRVRLTRRTRPNEIKSRKISVKRIPAVKLERIMRLRVDVPTLHFKTGAMQPHCRTAGAAEQIRAFHETLS